jgi:hypothetical protein
LVIVLLWTLVPALNRPVPESQASAVTQPSLTAATTLALGGEFLDELAKDTWFYLSSDWATSNHLPWSWRSESIGGGDYANPAEIGLFALAWIAVHDLGRAWSPTWNETEAEVTIILDQLRAWQTGSQDEQPHGPNAYEGSVFYQWYWISWDPPVVSGNPADHLVPVIDNAWLAVSLITIREYAEANAYPLLAAKADELLSDMDFRLWYHPDTHLFSWGDVEDPQGGFPADYYSNENRIVNFVARALGQLTAEEFGASLAALEGPSGSYDGIGVEKVAWDGSYFTYAAPALFVREMDTSYGDNTIVPATQAQIAYAQDNGYDAWGLSDCYDVGAGGYVQQGAPPAAMPDPPETRPGLVSPHAGALSLIVDQPLGAVDNLQVISDTFVSAYHAEYGFRDSVMANPLAPDYGQSSARFSALAQAWILLAIVDHDSQFVWDYLYRDNGVTVAHREMAGETALYLPVVSRFGAAAESPTELGSTGDALCHPHIAHRPPLSAVPGLQILPSHQTAPLCQPISLSSPLAERESATLSRVRPSYRDPQELAEEKSKRFSFSVRVIMR